MPDPGGEAGVRAYRTADLGRLDPSGAIHVDGRLDRQVEVNGFRVELGEIEAAALGCPGVGQAVASLTDTAIGSVLCLPVVPVGTGCDVDGLRRRLRRVLPAYAVPPRIHVAPTLRTNHNHKVAEQKTAAQAHRSTAGRSPVEAGSPLPATVGMLGVLLGREVRPDENFFDAGLNSISLIRLHAQLHRSWGLTVGMADLFAHPHARALADHLERGGGAAALRMNQMTAPEAASEREARRRIR